MSVITFFVVMGQYLRVQWNKKVTEVFKDGWSFVRDLFMWKSLSFLSACACVRAHARVRTRARERESERE